MLQLFNHPRLVSAATCATHNAAFAMGAAPGVLSASHEARDNCAECLDTELLLERLKELVDASRVALGDDERTLLLADIEDVRAKFDAYMVPTEARVRKREI